MIEIGRFSEYVANKETSILFNTYAFLTGELENVFLVLLKRRCLLYKHEILCCSNLTYPANIWFWVIVAIFILSVNVRRYLVTIEEWMKDVRIFHLNALNIIVQISFTINPSMRCGVLGCWCDHTIGWHAIVESYHTTRIRYNTASCPQNIHDRSPS